MRMDLSDKILSFIRQQKLVPPSSSTILLAVSGGPDSVAMAHAFNKIRHTLGVIPTIVHFNHRIRIQANQDEAFVKKLAQDLNMNFIRGEVARKPSGHASEDDLRKLRLAFLIKTAKRLKSPTIFLGHTENDLAETVLMRLLRGSGLMGLRGMLPVSIMDKVSLARPLLLVNRREIISYLKSHRLTFCTDHTNIDPVYTRNKIRHQLIPLLTKEYNPQLGHVLVDLAQTVGIDYDYLSQQALRLFKQHVAFTKSRVKINKKVFIKEHPAICRMLMRLIVEDLVGDTRQLTLAHILEFEKNLSVKKARVLWPNHIQITINAETIIISKT